MSACWSGSIHIDDQGADCDITLSCATQDQLPLPDNAALRYLSLVDVSRIPLHLIVGPQCDVTSESAQTQQWFSRLLHAFQHEQKADTAAAWWATTRPESPLGILVSVEAGKDAPRSALPRVTELLFYASRSQQTSKRPPTPPSSSPANKLGYDDGNPVAQFAVRAIALSIDLAVSQAEPTPPASPLGDAEADAVFLPSAGSTEAEVINEPPVRKRKSVNDTFDQATERRRKARRKGGEGVAAAAAIKLEESVPALKHRRSTSGSYSQPVPAQTRPLSRSPSVASSRPATARGVSEAAKRSSLSRVQSLPAPSKEEATELKNKELISRIVMAGMRLYGLSQSKIRKSRANSVGASPVPGDDHVDQHEDERDKDEEYKLVYHQVLKGTCFAFRQHIKSATLQPHTEALRETSDRLLAMYCSDPLEPGLPGTVAKLTPGGRKAFLSAGLGAEGGHSPFVDVLGVGV